MPKWEKYGGQTDYAIFWINHNVHDFEIIGYTCVIHTLASTTSCARLSALTLYGRAFLQAEPTVSTQNQKTSAIFLFTTVTLLSITTEKDQLYGSCQ